MSLAQVKSVIEHFVQNDRNDLLIIKGGWGVGKTFFWQKTVAEISPKGKIGHTNYSYVSLFGVESFETLKNTITANQIKSVSIGKDFNTSFSVLISKGKKLVKDVEKSNYLRNFSGGLGSELFFQSVRDSLICFDDLERKSDKFDIKDVLGLASFLKEQRNCKIVFILNDGTLTDEDREKFSRHNEKIVDIEIKFSPLAEEVFDYIFNESYPHFELIKFSCLTLQIKNIRILQRIRRFIEDLLPKLKEVEKIVAEDVIRSIILFVWSYYDKDSETISLDFIESFNSVDLYLKKRFSKGEITEEEEQKHKLLETYKYGQTDNLDRELISYVKQGFLDEQFFEELELKNGQFRSQQGKNSYKAVWELYKTSFELKEDDFVGKLVLAFRSNAKYLNFVDLYDTIAILRSFERDKLANDLIDEFLPKMITYERVTQLKMNEDFRNYKDEYYLKTLNEIPKPLTENYGFDEALRKLLSETRYYGEEVSFLASCDDEEYYNFFKTEKSSDIYYGAKYLLRLGEMNTTLNEVNIDGFNVIEQKKIENSENEIILIKTKNALLKIASESRINKIRISGWFDLQDK